MRQRKVVPERAHGAEQVRKPWTLKSQLSIALGLLLGSAVLVLLALVASGDSLCTSFIEAARAHQERGPAIRVATVEKRTTVVEPARVPATTSVEPVERPVAAKLSNSNDDNDDNKNKNETNDKVVLAVYVMSARPNFAHRVAIRQTWGRRLPGVQLRFVMGAWWCEVPEAWRGDDAPCVLNEERKAMRTTTNATAYNERERETSRSLEIEQSVYQDLVLGKFKDSYGNLAGKLKWAIAHAAEHAPGAWFVKIDDDVVLRMRHLRDYLSTIPAEPYRLIGHIDRENLVLKTGRWMELQYNDTAVYPPYGQGAVGYVLSPSLAGKLAEHIDELLVYRCEDAAVGIWIKRLGLGNATIFQHDKYFRYDLGNTLWHCLSESNPRRHFTFAHRFSPRNIRRCANYLRDLDDRVAALEAPSAANADAWSAKGEPTTS